MALVCPHCSRANRDKALTCTDCQTSLNGALHVPDQEGPNLVLIIGTLLAFLAMVWVAITFGRVMPPSESSDPSILRSQLAYNRCTEAIESQLGNATTLRFPTYEEVQLSITGTIYRFAGEVVSTVPADRPTAFNCEVQSTQAGTLEINSAIVIHP